jgi:hypothetical protein
MFSRTSSGIRNTHLFHSGFYVVIVEGSSDCPFWSNFFPDEINGYKRKLKPVGGRMEVQNYIDELLLNEAKFAVAVDSDYRFLLNRLHQDSRILETKYHSIENLMLSPSVMASAIRNLSHNTEYEVLTADNWLKHFDEATHSLMVADLVIEKNKLGKQCVGDNCFPFLVGNNNPIFDANKIDCFIQNLNLLVEEFDEMSEKVEKIKSRFHIRGHFIFSAVLCFVSHEVKKIRKKSVTISNDSFYAMLITQCESRIEIDPMLQAIREQALSAANELTNLLSQGA